jgi:hypothetical protein
VNSGSNVRLSFPTTLGSSYSVWTASTLKGTWSLQQSVSGTGAVKTVNIPTTGTAGYIKVTSP